MNKVLVYLFVLLGTNLIYTQQDANGWTVLDAGNAEKILYVSSSSGDDNNGEVYVMPSANVGDNPFSPSGSIRAFQTVQKAVSNLQNGEAAWVLLKRGDTFSFGLPVRSGKSKTQPFLYSSYGNSNTPPLLKTGAKSGISHCCKALEHFWVVGLSFYAHTRDPDGGEYVNANGDRGFYLESIRGAKLNNILLEGNIFRYYKDNVIQSFSGTGIVTDIKVRRNMILDGYNNSQRQSESVGFYAQNVNGLLLEENIFDHNGWLIPSYGDSRGTNGANGQATQYSHSTYFVDNQNVVFRGNSFNRPSNNGTKWVAQSTGSTHNVVMENNLFNDCQIGISMGTNYSGGSYRFKDIAIRNNVMVHPGRSNQTRSGLAWGITINDWDDGSYTGNIMTSQEYSAKSGFGVRILGETRKVTVADNIFYNLQDSGGIVISDKGSYSDVALTKNEFTYFENFKIFVQFEKSSFDGIQFDRNTYSNADNIERPFLILGKDYEFDEWSARVPSEHASSTPPDYPDPSRDLDRYVDEVLGLNGIQEYYSELRKQSKLNWREAYTGKAIASWIRNGFRATSNADNTPPVPDIGKLTVINGECSIDEVDIPTATDNVSGRVQGTSNVDFPITASTTIAWKYTDGAGNSATQEQQVIISNSSTPVPNIPELPEINGSCSVTVTEIPTATDGCNGTVEATANIDIETPLTESTVIEWSYIGPAGESVTQEQRVIISNGSALVPELTELPDIKSACSVMVTEIPTANDGCNGTITATANIDIKTPLTETTTIEWTYNGSSEESLVQEQQVIITGSSTPEPIIAELPKITGTCSVLVTDIPSATDGCNGIIKASTNIDLGTPLTETTTIEWIYRGSSGENVTQEQQVVISDGAIPVPDLPELPEIKGACSATITEVPTATDGCDGTVSGTANIDLTSPLTESTTIEWTYSGSSGKSFTQEQRVVIETENAAPEPDLVLLQGLYGQCSVTVTDIPTATDGCDGTVNGTANIDLTSPLTESTTIEWTYTGSSGKTFTQEQRVIIETENSAPEPDVPLLEDLYGQCSVTVTDIPTATDGCNGTVEATANIDISTPFTESTTIGWIFTGATGEQVTQEQWVVITDDSRVPLPDKDTLQDLTGECSVMVSEVPTATLGCNETVEAVANVNISEPITESTTIEWTYSGSSGERIVQEQRVVLASKGLPLPSNPSLLDLTGNCSIALPETPTAITSCGDLLDGVPDVQFPITDQSKKEIVWTYTDANGMSISQTQNVSLSKTTECDKPTLEDTDFEILVYGETCENTNDGMLSIVALAPDRYTVRIENNEGYQNVLDFSNRLDIENLSPGLYKLCLSPSDGDTEFCKEINIVPFEKLSVEYTVLNDGKQLVLYLKGNSEYTVTVNGKSFVTDEEELSIDLDVGTSELSVATANTCQQIFSAVLMFSENISVYPNPIFDGLLHLYYESAGDVSITVHISDIAGKILKSYTGPNMIDDEFIADVSDLSTGIYVIHIETDEKSYTAKFVIQ